MSKASIERYLTEQDFFVDLDPEYIKFLAGCAVERRLEENEIVFLYGKEADRFYLLRSGCISIEVAAIEGPPLQLQTLEAGQVLGWSWLISPYKWHFQARTVEPTDVLEFDGKLVFERCEEDSKFGYELLKRFSGMMSERLDIAREAMKDEWSPKGFA